jgi:hypothetical protein
MMVKSGSSRHLLEVWVFATLLLFTAGLISANAQMQLPGVQYDRGQDVSPTYDGWERNPDGTVTMYFGYYNRNSQEEIDVPIGPENSFDLGNGDQGQPTHFYAGRRWWLFQVVVPKDWPPDKRLVWTLTTKGRTSQAKGWLQPEWEVDKLLISKNSVRDSFLGVADSTPNPDNKAPVMTGSPAQTITLPAMATLKVTATDDGLPKPGAGDRGGRVQGVRIRWFLYRGPGKVQFDPDSSPGVYGQPVTLETKVSFSVPGNYRIRAIAIDGALFSSYDVDVKVNPSTSAEKAR